MSLHAGEGAAFFATAVYYMCKMFKELTTALLPRNLEFKVVRQPNPR
jgi:hypothetical protein